MSYLDSGFSDLLQRDIFPTSNNFSTIDVDSLLEGIDVSKVFSTGAMKSSDGRLSFDLEQNVYSVSDGTVETVRLGRMEDGDYGIRIRDRNGTDLMVMTSTQTLLQSPDGKMQVDLKNGQIRSYDDTNLRAIFGRRKT